MAETNAPPLQAQMQLPRLRDPQYREVYSNGNLVSITPFDISVTFQRIMDVVPGQAAAVDQVFVTMSPQNFKGFVNALQGVLTAYEQAFGNLTIPEQDTRPMRSPEEILAGIQAARSFRASSIGQPQPSGQSVAVDPQKAKQP